MAGLGGIRPESRDVSRRRDRQAAWILLLTAVVTALFFYPVAVVVAVATAGYAYVSGERVAALIAAVLAVAVVVAMIVDGFGDGLAT